MAVLCARPGCGQPVLPPQRKYCSPECSAWAVHQQSLRQVAARKSVLSEQKTARTANMKPRVCLSCGSSFLSEGTWNRICADCESHQSELGPHARGQRVSLDDLPPSERNEAEPGRRRDD